MVATIPCRGSNGCPVLKPTLGRIAGLAQQVRPLVADVLRVRIEPARDQVLGQLAHHLDRHRHLALRLPLADHPQQPAFQGLVVVRIGRVFHPLQIINRGGHHFRQPKPGRVKQMQPTNVSRWLAEVLVSIVNCASMNSHCARLKLRPAFTLGPAVRGTPTADQGLPIR